MQICPSIRHDFRGGGFYFHRPKAGVIKIQCFASKHCDTYQTSFIVDDYKLY